jgi:hypothetical protein
MENLDRDLPALTPPTQAPGKSEPEWRALGASPLTPVVMRAGALALEALQVALELFRSR